MKYDFQTHGGPIYLPIKYQNFAQSPFYEKKCKLYVCFFPFHFKHFPSLHNNLHFPPLAEMSAKNVSFFYGSTEAFNPPTLSSLAVPLTFLVI